MPLYLTTLQPGRTSVDARAKIAATITEVHVDVTGAPIQFVNAFFCEHPDHDGGFGTLPTGKIALVRGNIRAGRSAASKAEMIERITAGVVDALSCPASQVQVVLTTGPAEHGMEGGKVLPAPGSLEEEAWKAHGGAPM